MRERDQKTTALSVLVVVRAQAHLGQRTLASEGVWQICKESFWMSCLFFLVRSPLTLLTFEHQSASGFSAIDKTIHADSAAATKVRLCLLFSESVNRREDKDAQLRLDRGAIDFAKGRNGLGSSGSAGRVQPQSRCGLGS